MLKNDKRVIFTRSSHAQRAIEASIAAHGLLTSLDVLKAAGSYTVIAGQCRYCVPLAIWCSATCWSATPTRVEIGGAENAVRIAMDPADQFEASARLSKREQACRILPPRCGVSATLAEKRVKLGRTGPAKRDARFRLWKCRRQNPDLVRSAQPTRLSSLTNR